MAFSIEEIKSQLTFGGARQSLFQVQFFNPANSVADIKVPFLARAASLPASNLGTIQVPYFGRFIKLAGDRTFEAWSVTVINDEDFLIRNALEEWMNSINAHAANVRNAGAVAPSSYSVDAYVTQYGKDGTAIKSYTFVGLFPVDVAPIDLDWGSNDSIEEYAATFAFQYWESNTTS